MINPSTPATPLPYWRLSGFYLVFCASIGAFLPYWGLYLQSRGFDAAQIGVLVAVTTATKIVSPNVWGWIADRTGRHMVIVRYGSLAALLIFSGVLWVRDYAALALVLAAFSFFWNATLPQFEAVTLNYLGTGMHRYSGIRLWGSVGFIAAVLGVGPLLDHGGMNHLPWVLLGLMAAIWLASLCIAERPAAPRHEPSPPIATVLRDSRVLALFLVCFLMQAGHGPYYTFYSIYLEAHGYSRTVVGGLWSLGVVSEIVVFLLMYRLFPRVSLRVLLLVSLAVAAVRWVLVAYFVDYPAVLIGAQVLHAATYGVYHLAAIQLIHGYFQGAHQGKGQALYSSVGFGAGGAVGSLYAGYMWNSVGATATYSVAAVLSLLALIIAWRAVGVVPSPVTVTA